MSPITLEPWALLIGALAIVVLMVLVMRWAQKQKPSSVEVSAEEAAFNTLEKALEVLADKSGELKTIAAAQARMDMKDKLLSHATAKLIEKTGLPAAVSATQPPPAQ